MRARMTFNTKEFDASVQAAISKVGAGTKKATIEACKEIIEMSLAEVPRETTALAQSAAYEVYGGNRKYEGVISYGLLKDVRNPLSGAYVSTYAAIVHEDFDAYHPIGKAKFLEDPVLAFAESRFNRSYARILKSFSGF